VETGAAGLRPEYDTATVLLVDDEPDVRKLVGRILLRQGYTLLEASDGDEATYVAQRHGGPIHLLLTDIVMPRMSGRDLAEQLAPMRPEMRVLFMSGRMEDSTVQNLANLTTAFIPKPFTPDALITKVRDVLGARGFVSAG
jgi:two-component system, cell cycle sensor histidine kinase and response regulator CckA